MRDYKVLTLRYIVQPQQSDSKGLITRKHRYQYFLHIRSLKDAGTRENQSHWSHSEATLPYSFFDLGNAFYVSTFKFLLLENRD